MSSNMWPQVSWWGQEVRNTDRKRELTQNGGSDIDREGPAPTIPEKVTSSHVPPPPPPRPRLARGNAIVHSMPSLPAFELGLWQREQRKTEQPPQLGRVRARIWPSSGAESGTAVGRSRATHGYCRRRLGRSWSEVSQSSTSVGQIWAQTDHLCPGLAANGAGIGTRAMAAQIGTEAEKTRPPPSSAPFGPTRS